MSDFEEVFKYTKKTNKITKKSFKQYWEELQLAKIKNTMLVEELIQNVLASDSKSAVTVLQNSYNILQVKEKERLVVDGIMGEKTINALNKYKNPLELFVWINMNQFNYFREHNVSNQFMKEWINDKVITNVREFFKEKDEDKE